MSLIGKWSWWKDEATATTNITASYSDRVIDYEAELMNDNYESR